MRACLYPVGICVSYAAGDKAIEYLVFDDGSEWTLFRGLNTCESNGLSIEE